MSYVLATTGKSVRWYVSRERADKSVGLDTVAELDLAVVPQYDDKAAAKVAATSMGLKTWRYVKLL